MYVEGNQDLAIASVFFGNFVDELIGPHEMLWLGSLLH